MKYSQEEIINNWRIRCQRIAQMEKENAGMRKGLENIKGKKLLKALTVQLNKSEAETQRLKAQSPPDCLIPELKQHGIYNPDWKAS